MKRLLLFLLAQFPLWSGFDYIKESNRIENQIVKEICEEYNLRIFGFGGGYMDEYDHMHLSFQYPKPLTISAAEDMLVQITEKVLARINESRSLRPYLHNYPFTVKNVWISIQSLDYTTNESYSQSEVDSIDAGKDGICIWKQKKILLEEPYAQVRALVLGKNNKSQSIKDEASQKHPKVVPELRSSAGVWRFCEKIYRRSTH